MTLLRDGAEVPDGWTRIAAEDPRLDGDTPLTGDLLVPAALYSAAHARLAPGARLGVEGRAEGEEALQIAAAAAHGADMVALVFPSFSDGRGFSLAKRLRQAGYDGILRAVGPLIPDQCHFAESVGFDELEIPDAMALRTGPEHYAGARGAAVGRYQLGYAKGGDDAPVSILAARHADRLRIA
ncbi:MAG: hypothetical protein ACJARE_001490 [Paracoccaceae bacterium]|jgi:uncharacterized protein (DUF934 family)